MRRSANHVRDELAGAIRGAAKDGCPTCSSLACAVHAAEAILAMARSQKLLILDEQAASETIDAAGLLYADNRGPVSQDWPPRAGDVWRDGSMGDTWFARLDADGNVEFVDYAGFVLSARGVAQIKGGMHLINRAAPADPATVRLTVEHLGDFTADLTRITVDANKGVGRRESHLQLHVVPTAAGKVPDEPAWYVTDLGGDQVLHLTTGTWIGEWTFRQDTTTRAECLTDLHTAVRHASESLRRNIEAVAR